MININKRRAYIPVIVGAFFVLMALVLGFIATQRIASAAPVDITVTMFTHEDSHPDPGDGCSLYEASIAASTAAAYGGCEPGSVDGSTILLGEGTYSHSEEDIIALELDNTGLVGMGRDNTVLDKYNISLSGNQASSVESLTITHTIAHTLLFYIAGSNKTIENVSMLQSLAPVRVWIDPNDSTVTNTSMKNVIVDGSAGSNIICEGTCSNVTIEDVDTGVSSSMANVNLGSTSEITINGLRINSTSSSHLSVGEDSAVENVSLTTLCGSNTVSVDTGTTVNDLKQTGLNGCGVTFNGTAASITNVEQYMGGSGGMSFNASADVVSGLSQVMDGLGSVGFNASVRETTDYTTEGGVWSFTNSYDGSIIRNLQARPSSSGTSFAAYAQTLDNVLIDRTSATNAGPIIFANSRDGAVISDVSLINPNPSEGGKVSDTATIYGNNVNIDNFVVDSHSNAGASLSIMDPGVNINDLLINGGRLILSDAGDATVENFSISNSIPGVMSPSIFSPFSDGEIVIRNGLFSNVAGGVYASASNPGSKLLVENVQFNNLQGSGSPQGAVFASGIDEVTIRNVTSNRTINPDQHGAISIFGGSSHKISNTTIVDGTGGIAAYQAFVPMALDINNVTIVNNEDSAEHQGSSYRFAIHAALINDDGAINVRNSLIGGSSPYIECSDNTMPDTNLSLTNTLVNHDSCVDFGGTLVSDFDDVVHASLADNGGSGSNIGYDGSFGNLLTLALLPVSDNPALLVGDNSTCEATDSRGTTRPDGMCDIGAFQLSSLVEDVDTGTDGSVAGDGEDVGTPGAPNTGLQRVQLHLWGLLGAVTLVASAWAGVSIYRRLY